MTALSVTSFIFESHKIRTSILNGEPWFVAQDVCNALKISNSRDALLKLDHDEKGVGLTDTLGGKQQVNIISESGMYFLTIRCRDAVKPGTLPHRFRKWVTAEVLPSIRKTGSYQQQVPVETVQNEEYHRYHVRVIIQDTLFGGTVEFLGKGDSFKAIANGIAIDIGYKPTGFITVPVDNNKFRRIC